MPGGLSHGTPDTRYGRKFYTSQATQAGVTSRTARVSTYIQAVGAAPPVGSSQVAQEERLRWKFLGCPDSSGIIRGRTG